MSENMVGNAAEFLHTIWFKEPQNGSIKIDDVIEAMEKYAEYKINDFILRMPIDSEPGK